MNPTDAADASRLIQIVSKQSAAGDGHGEENGEQQPGAATEQQPEQQPSSNRDCPGFR